MKKLPNRYVPVICIDLDGVICHGETWTPKGCLDALPDEKVIEAVRKTYLSAFIVVYTARRDELIPATLEWLRRNNVRYHAFSNQKIGAEVYVDDKNKDIDWLKDITKLKK